MKKFLLLSALFMSTITPMFAGTIKMQNLDIAPGRCVLKLYTTWNALDQSNNTASQVIGLPAIGASATRQIPNGTYQAILLDCKIESFGPKPSDINPKTPDMKHAVGCNSEDPWGFGSMNYLKPIKIKSTSPDLAISVDFGGKQAGANTNSGHCAFINMHEFQ